jgi:hypothetical protein
MDSHLIYTVARRLLYQVYSGYAIIKDSIQCRSIQKQIHSNVVPTTLIYNKTGTLIFKQN